MSILDWFTRMRRKVKPTKTIGTHSAVTYGGVLRHDERHPDLATREKRYRVYSDILSNTSIVAAGTRYFLNLTSKSRWSFVPSESDTDGRFAELTEKALMHDPETPWHRIIRRAAMYRFYGFSVQEWTAKRDDGMITFLDIAPRAQPTISKWDIDRTGLVLGVVQVSPQTMKELYIPRNKLLYVVDDTLSDTPEGLGIFRHIVAPCERLARYEQLEGFGFETDLRGIPIGRAPFTELAGKVQTGHITTEQREQIERPLRDFISNHIRTAKLGMFLDSLVYESRDDAGRPSAVRQWDIELLQGSSTSFAENAAAIKRINREIARVLGVEQMLLGESSGGSYALSSDKTSSFFLLVDSVLLELREAVKKDLINVLWNLNGWPEEKKPSINTEVVRHNSAEDIATVLRDMATAGAILSPDDPIIDEVRDVMGMSRSVKMEDDLLTEDDFEN